MDPMVRFEKVTKRYGELVVLDALDLDVAPNEKVSIIGQIAVRQLFLQAGKAG